jgi:hypothetical protein
MNDFINLWFVFISLFRITTAVIWTCIQYLVLPTQQGFATGILLSIYHLSQSLIPIVVSYMITAKLRFVDSHVSKHKFIDLEIIDIKNCEAFFVAMSILALFCSLVIFIFDESGHAELRLSGLTTSSPEYHLLESGDFTDVEVQKNDDLPVQTTDTHTSGLHMSTQQQQQQQQLPGVASGKVVRPRSKSMSDSAPLTSCMRKYYMKERVKGRPPQLPVETVATAAPVSTPAPIPGNRLGLYIDIGVNNSTEVQYDSDDHSDEHSHSPAPESPEVHGKRRTVSFAGDCDFTPHRRAGEGQHPAVAPLSIHIPNKTAPPAAGYHKKMIFSHF